MSKERLAAFDAAMDEINTLSPETVDTVLAMTPWQGQPPGSLASSDRPVTDEDGFTMGGASIDGAYSYTGFAEVQARCWNKFKENPFVFTTILDKTGRLTGYGFSQSSTYPKAQDFMVELWEDPRNGLVQNFTKYIARAIIQGELFLTFTVHDNGFVEVDFISPSVIKGFKSGSGILMAKGKPLFPLMYRVEDTRGEAKFIPSINTAYYPELMAEALANDDVKTDAVVGRDAKPCYEKLNNYRTYMVQWDQGFVTERNVGQTNVSLKWLEHYDNLKKWEIDHKKSSGAYLWAIEIADRSAFRLWMGMSEDEKKKTGLMQRKVPGGTVMLPPGFKINCHNPKLASITNQDNDILQMISAGLNTPEDVMTGSSSGTTFSGAKLSRGPVSDRTQDQISELQRWLIHGFWRGALWLHHRLTQMPWEYSQRAAYKFEKGKPKFKNVKVPAHKTIEISFPSSEMGDIEGKTRAYLGVKHGPVAEQLGISNGEVANKLGFQSYHQSRLSAATEEESYPELKTAAELETMQSQAGEAGLEPAVNKRKTEEKEKKA